MKKTLRDMHKDHGKSKRYWFKRKKYGYGWYPYTWEGWVTVLGAMVVIILLSLSYGHRLDTTPLPFTLGVIIVVGLLILLSYLKGETPRWQWGGEPIHKKKK